MISTRAQLALGAATVVTLVSQSLWANGRFPNADHMVVDANDTDHMVVRATFGIVQTFDAGQSWSWLCEPAVGYGGTDDPAIGVTSLGHLLVGIRDGVARGSIGGCDWATDPTGTAGLRIVDLAVDVTDPTIAIAISGDGDDGAPRIVVTETVDEGATWAALGPDLEIDLLPQTIDAAPSDPQRLYISAVAGVSNDPVIERSFDRGASWTRIPIDIDGAERTFISAISPSDPDVIYLRVTGETEDRLFLSEDAADSFTQLVALEGDMLGFALAPDGTKVAVGMKQGGVHVANTSDHVFEKASDGGVRCLSWATTGLFACANEGDDGFTVGRSDDAGANFVPLYHLLDIILLDCPARTDTGDTCPALFDALLDQLGNRGAGGSSSASSTGVGGSGGGPPSESDSGGGSCALSSWKPPVHHGSVALMVASAAWLRRRRGFVRPIALTRR